MGSKSTSPPGQDENESGLSNADIRQPSDQLGYNTALCSSAASKSLPEGTSTDDATATEKRETNFGVHRMEKTNSSVAKSTPISNFSQKTECRLSISKEQCPKDFGPSTPHPPSKLWRNSTNLNSLQQSKTPKSVFERRIEAKLSKARQEEVEKLVLSLKSELLLTQNKLRVSEEVKNDWKKKYEKILVQRDKLIRSERRVSLLGLQNSQQLDWSPSTDSLKRSVDDDQSGSSEFGEAISAGRDGDRSTPVSILRRDELFYLYRRPDVLSSIDDYAQYVDMLECQLTESRDQINYLSSDLIECQRRVSELKGLIESSGKHSCEINTNISLYS
jgi:hypothetical protein